jgi:hypothetical protein
MIPRVVRCGDYMSITLFMLDALCHKLTNVPWLHREEMVSFLRDEYEVEVSTSSITRAMQSRRWSKKVTCRVARQRKSVLRHLYHYKLSKYRSYHLIFIDESGCDPLTTQRRTGWAPIGITPVHVADFKLMSTGNRYCKGTLDVEQAFRAVPHCVKS